MTKIKKPVSKKFNNARKNVIGKKPKVEKVKVSKDLLPAKIVAHVGKKHQQKPHENLIMNDNEDSDDDSSEDGFSEIEKEEKNEKVTTVSDAPAKKNKKQHVEAKVKPPTLEEINDLKETRNLFHSNLFRLQVQEMLSELKVKPKYTRQINTWLEKFKGFVRKLSSETEKYNVSEMPWLKDSLLTIPFQFEQFRVASTSVLEKNLQFQFIKPNKEPYLLGAVALDTLLGPELVADICLPMPAECFQKHNYINYMYDYKRALYLTYVTWQMLQPNGAKELDDLNLEQLKFNYYANNPLKPILEIRPNGSSKLRLRIFVAAEETTFKLSRFVPWNNNIRQTIFKTAQDDDGGEEDATLSGDTWATPSYNANVLFDLSMHANQRVLRETFATQSNFQEGLVLLKVWLRQRHLHVGYTGCSAHLLAMYIVYLRNQKKLHMNMSSYQVARTLWNQLAQSAWDVDGKGISLCIKKLAVNNQPTLEQMHTYYDVVFIDATGFNNICANLSLEVYKRLRSEAQLAVDLLNDMKLNSFQLIFMKECPPYTQYDHILKISKPDAIDQLLELHVPPADRCNFAGYTYPLLLKLFTGLLNKGLSDRVNGLIPIEKAMESWSVHASQVPVVGQNLYLGILLNEEHAFEILNKGPESIAEASEEFRKFWGEKAQLRRFQDGTITESVVWANSSDTLRQKRLIVRNIVLHLLQHHYQLDPVQDVHYIAGEFDVVYSLTSAYKLPKLHAKCNLTQQTDSEAASLPVIHAFDALSRQLTALKNLPLDIVNIAGISAVFRYCDPVPLLPVARLIGADFYADSVPRAIIQLGQSGKWPSELEALRALKLAFYIKIANLLREQCKLQVKVATDGILVHKYGYCFGFELAHTKELALLKQEKNERGITQYVHSVASRALEKNHYILPRVSAALHALYQKQPCFGPTVMISKRWLYAQLIDSGLWPDEVTELLVASLFVNRQIQIATCTPQTGYLRFLQLLAQTDWRTEFFLLNFNNVTDNKTKNVLEQNFTEMRDTYPPLCIATSFDEDHQGQLWSTHDCPNINVLVRVTLLARQALDMIQESLYSTQLAFIQPAQLFRSSNEGYDLVIQLKPELITTAKVPNFGSPFVAPTKPNWRLPLADANWFADAVVMLREAYSNFAAFFYNPCGGKEIGVKWRPHIFETLKDFKVVEVQGYSMSDKVPGKLVCKRETLIEDFKFILKDYYLRMGSLEQVMIESKADASNHRKSKAMTRYFTEQNNTISNDKEVSKIEKIVDGKLQSIHKDKVKSRTKAASSKTSKIKNPVIAKKVKKILLKVK